MEKVQERFATRIKVELDLLRDKGLLPTRENRTISVTVPILDSKHVKNAVLLLGLLKFRKTDLNTIGRNVLLYAIDLCTLKYRFNFILNPGWPFRMPNIKIDRFHVIENLKWTADYKLYDVIKSFKCQCHVFESEDNVSSVSLEDFFFMKKGILPAYVFKKLNSAN